MGKDTIVAICIPYYEKFECLIRLIESIKRQTFHDFIVVVTDDGGDIRVKEYMESLGENYVYVRNEERKGPTANCNYAMELGQCYYPKYIKIMHQDDSFAYDYSLERMVEKLDNNKEAVFVGSGCFYMREGRKISEQHINTKQLQMLKQDFYSIIEANIIGPPSLLLVRNNGIYMDENLQWIVDEEWYFKLLEYKNCFEYLDEPLISIGLDEGRVTDSCIHNLELLEREFSYVYVKHFQIQNSKFDPIVHNSSRVYDGERQQGFYLKGDFCAIIKDAVKDHKKLGIWADSEQELEKAERNLWEALKIRLDFYYAEEGKLKKIDGVLSQEQVLSMGTNVMWIIVKKQARDIRRMLNDSGINAIPYNERHFVT